MLPGVTTTTTTTTTAVTAVATTTTTRHDHVSEMFCIDELRHDCNELLHHKGQTSSKRMTRFFELDLNYSKCTVDSKSLERLYAFRLFQYRVFIAGTIDSKLLKRQFDPSRVRQQAFEEIFSKAIIFFLLIQEGRLSVSSERMCTSTG